MESTGRVVKWENAATRHKIAVISAACFLLGSLADNVCAQNAANEDRVIQPTSPTVMSTDPAPAGEIAMISLSLTEVQPTEVVPNLTLFRLPRWAPMPRW